MAFEQFDLPALARYLQRDARTLEKLASRGSLPGRRVGGQWRFNRDEVNQWLERQLGDLTDDQLEDVEVGVRGDVGSADELNLVVSSLMSVESTATPMEGRTAPGVLQSLVEVANRSWNVYEPDKVLDAVRSREGMLSTAQPGGVAIPHPRRPLPDAFGEPMVAYGRTPMGIPFGGSHGQMTDLFFLVLCKDDRSHLQVLARLARLFQREGFLQSLREASDPVETLSLIRIAEEEVIA